MSPTYSLVSSYGRSLPRTSIPRGEARGSSISLKLLLILLLSLSRMVAWGQGGTNESQPGLKVSYSSGYYDYGVVSEDVVPNIDFDWGNGSPNATVPNDDWAAHYEGFVTAPYTGDMEFQTLSDDGVRLVVNGQQVLSNWTQHAPVLNTGHIQMVQGERIPIVCDYFEYSYGASLKLMWKWSGQTAVTIPSTAFSHDTIPAPPNYPLNTIRGGGFEVPDLGARNFYYRSLLGSEWNFNGHAGIANNLSPFNNYYAPEGVQVAFLQLQGSMKQTVPMTAGSYRLRFYEATRFGQSDDFVVKVDGTSVTQFTKNNSAGSGAVIVTTDPFTVTAGNHEICFAGLASQGGDRTVFIDRVRLIPAADPTPPAAVTLNNPIVSGWKNDIIITWSQSQEQDFKCYRVYMATHPGVSEADELVESSFDWRPESTEGGSFNCPPTPSPGTRYYFRVYVVDDTGATTGSNEVSILQLDEPPTAVTLDPPTRSAENPDTVNLTWSQNEDDDFYGYHVYAATHPNVTEADEEVANLEWDLATESTTVQAPATAVPGTTYYYRVFVEDYNDEGNPGLTTGSNEVSISQVTPDPVSNLTATAGSSEVTLSWTLGDGATSFGIKRATVAGGPYTTLTAEPTTPTYIDNGLTNGTTYYYRVFALNGGHKSTDSAEVSGTPELVNESQPGLKVSYSSGNYDYGVKFEDVVPNIDFDLGNSSPNAAVTVDQWAAHYEGFVTAPYTGDVEFQTLSDDGVRLIVDGQQILSNWTSHPPTLDSGHIQMVQGERIPIVCDYYDYVYGASLKLMWKWQGQTAVTIPAVAFSHDTIPTPPSYPLNTIRNGGFEVPNLGTRNAYYRSLNGSEWNFKGPAGMASNISPVDNETSPEGVQEAMLQEQGSMTQTVPMTAGTYRLRFFETVRRGISEDFVVKVDGAIVGQFTKTNPPDNWEELTTTPFTVTTGNHEITFASLATQGGTRIVFIDKVRIIPAANPAPPTAVTLNTPTHDNDKDDVSFTWSENQDIDFLGYRVYQATHPGVTEADELVASYDWHPEMTSGGAYSPATLAPGTTYYYRVFVSDDTGATTGSNEVSILQLDEPPTAVTLDAPVRSTTNPDTLNLSWSQTPDYDFYAYRVYAATHPNVTEADELVASNEWELELNTATVQAPGTAAPGTTYYYRVYVEDYNGHNDEGVKGQTTGSNEVSITQVIPGAVTNLSATPSNGSITLSWTPGDGATSFGIKRAMVEGGPYTTLTAEPINASYTDTGLTNGTTYYYRVFGINGGHKSTDSVEVNATPTNLPLAPSNDDFANAQVIVGTSGSETANTQYATRETEEPAHAGDLGVGTIWYQWTAPSSGNIIFDTIGSDFDTTLAAYTGTALNGLTGVASNDDIGGTNNSEISFSATEGTVYSIAVSGFSTSRGSVVFNWHQPPPPPDNDNFADAQVITGMSGSTTANTESATREEGEPLHAGVSGDGTIWYQWTAPTTGSINFNTVGSDFDTTLGIYTGTVLNALTEVASDDDSGGDGTSQASISATAGTTYYIAVSGYADSRGTVAFNWGLPPSPPANDNFANAQVITGMSGSVAGNNGLATAEIGEPAHLGSGAPNASIWYRWVAPQSGVIGFSASQLLSSVLAIYTGNAIDDLTLVARNVNNPIASFTATAGTTYYLAFDSYIGKGHINLDWEIPVPLVPSGPNIGNITKNSMEIFPLSAAELATSRADSIEAQMKLASAPDSSYVAITTGPSGEANITGLEIGVAYTFRYLITNGAGTAYSLPTTRTTLELAPPAAPAAPSFSHVTSSSVRVQTPDLSARASYLMLQRAVVGSVPSSASITKSDLQFWFKADSLPLTDGAVVYGWGDSSGANRHATRLADSGLGGVGPFWFSDAAGGRPVIRSAGNNPLLGLPTVAVDFSQGLTSFVVARHSDAAGNTPFWGIARQTSQPGTGIDNNGFSFGRTDTAAYYNVYENYNLATQTAADVGTDDGTLKSYSMTQEAGEAGVQHQVSLFKNGQLQGEAGPAAVPHDSSYDQNFIGYDSLSSARFTGDIAEILIYNTTLTPTQRASVEAYLAGKYSMAPAPENLSWTTIDPHIAGNATYDDTTLDAVTSYAYRCIAVNDDGSADGPAANVSTAEVLPAAPGAPEAPQFSNIASTSLHVLAPQLPARTFWLKLQHKLANQPDSQFQDVKDVLGAGQDYFVEGLQSQAEHVFRYVAIGDGQETPGASASVETIAPAVGQGSGLRGTYFRYSSFQNQIFARLDSKIDFSWGTGSPGPDVPKDDFTVRWEGKIEPRFTENYVFTADVDDQVVLWIDGVRVIDRMRIVDFAGVYDSAPVLLQQGHQYSIRMDYHERADTAQAHLFWSSASQTKEIIPSTQLYPALPIPTGNKAEGNGLKGYYFNDPEFTQPVMERIDPSIDFEWGNGSPSADISPDSFSVRWVGQVEVPTTSNYAFYANADDVSRITIDGNVVYDAFISTGEAHTPWQVVHLNAGERHDFVVEFIEYYNSAHISLFYADMGDAAPGNVASTPNLVPLPPEWLFPTGTNQTFPALSDGNKLFLSAECVSQNAPTTLHPGEERDVTIVMKNTGLRPYTLPSDPSATGVSGFWTPGLAYRLVSQSWSKNRIWNTVYSDYAYPQDVHYTNYNNQEIYPSGAFGLPAGGIILNRDIFGPNGSGIFNPTQTVTFNVHIKAPQEPGTYPFQWKMTHPLFEPDGFNSVTPLVNIQVVPETPPISRTLKVENTTATSVQLKLPPLYPDSTGWTVQRALAPATLVAPPSDGMALWLKPENLKNQAPNAPLMEWSDASGANMNASQPVGVSRPTYIPHLLNGQGAAHFDGNQKFFDLPSGFDNWGAGVSAFAVLRPSKVAPWSRFLDIGSKPGADDLFLSDGLALARAGDSNRFHYHVWRDYGDFQAESEDGLAGNDWRTLSVVHQGANEADPLLSTTANLYTNGALQSSAEMALPPSKTYTSNFMGKSNFGDAYFVGDIAELLLYNRAVSETERTAIETYLQRKFDVNSSTDGLTWENVATDQDGNISYTNSGLDPRTVYWYRVVPEGVQGDPVGPVKARTLPPAPAAPPTPQVAPEPLSVTNHTITFVLPPAPAEADGMQLEYRDLGADDTDWVRVDGEERTETRLQVADLDTATSYRFRWIAIGEGGETAGPTTDVTTSSVPAPGVPEAPQFRTEYSPPLSAILYVIMPPLPDGATHLLLQEKHAEQPDAEFATLLDSNGEPRQLDGDSEVMRNQLENYQSYSYRVIAVGPGGQTTGPAAGITLTAPPPAPGAPVITPTGVDSVNVTAPAYAEILRLEMKLATQDDSAYQIVARNLSGASVTPVVQMIPGQTYVFRYVGQERNYNGGLSYGATAQVTMPLPTISWTAGTPISCNGIRFPRPSDTVAPGVEQQLFAFVATDWDEQLSTAGGFVKHTRHTDPCTYTWSVSGGTFKNGEYTGQTAIWIAPGPGVYTLTLTVDDRNGANIGNGETGTRNDSGFNDTPLQFTTTITVL